MLERFTRDGYQCYRLFDDESASEGDPIVESCPESEIAPNDVTFEATGSLDGGPEYLVVTVPEAAMLLEASGPFTRSGPWLAIEAIDTSGTYSVRFENLGGEFLCSILMPIHVECDLVRMLE